MITLPTLFIWFQPAHIYLFALQLDYYILPFFIFIITFQWFMKGSLTLLLQCFNKDRSQPRIDLHNNQRIFQCDSHFTHVLVVSKCKIAQLV